MKVSELEDCTIKKYIPGEKEEKSKFKKFSFLSRIETIAPVLPKLIINS